MATDVPLDATAAAVATSHAALLRDLGPLVVAKATVFLSACLASQDALTGLRSFGLDHVLGRQFLLTFVALALDEGAQDAELIAHVQHRGADGGPPPEPPASPAVAWWESAPGEAGEASAAEKAARAAGREDGRQEALGEIAAALLENATTNLGCLGDALDEQAPAHGLVHAAFCLREVAEALLAGLTVHDALGRLEELRGMVRSPSEIALAYRVGRADAIHALDESPEATNLRAAILALEGLKQIVGEDGVGLCVDSDLAWYVTVEDRALRARPEPVEAIRSAIRFLLSDIDEDEAMEPDQRERQVEDLHALLRRLDAQLLAGQCSRCGARPAQGRREDLPVCTECRAAVEQELHDERRAF